MNIGLNNEGERVRPFPSGRARCQFCEDQLIAKCGPFVDWHWAHTATRNCDPWHEHETPWHREWKNRFPREWHEVIHHDPETGEKHIADAKCPNGLILEFQNSPMSLVELQSREAFYGNMIWVVNLSAQRGRIHFSETQNDEFVRLSVDTRSRRKIAEATRVQDKTVMEEEIRKVEAKLERMKYRMADAKSNIEQHGHTIAALRSQQGVIAGLATFAYAHVADVVRGQFRGTEFEKAMKASSREIVKLNAEIEVLEKRLDRYSKFPKWSSTEWSTVPYPKGNKLPDLWQRLRYMSRSEEQSLFAQLHEFTSRAELQQHKEAEHYYYCDLTSEVSALAHDVKEKRESVAKLIVECKKQMSREIDGIVQYWEDERLHAQDICKPESGLSKEIESLSSLHSERKQLLASYDSELELTLEEIDAEEAYKKEVIEDKFVNIFRYDWSHPKKVWNQSKVPVFLDIGDEHVYRLIDWRLVQRIDKEEFAENIKHCGVIPVLPTELPARRTMLEMRGG
ncbi:MAG: hypothetical protein WBB32_01855 [Flavobacteriales bacterium]